MAHLIQAVRAYGPQLTYGRTAGPDQLAEWLSRSSGLNRNAVRMALSELSEAVLFYVSMGTSVYLPGIGRFRATIGQDGELRIHLLPERSLVDGINRKNAYHGEIRNSDRIGWTAVDFKAMWDTEHPDDPLELPAGLAAALAADAADGHEHAANGAAANGRKANRRGASRRGANGREASGRGANGVEITDATGSAGS